MYLCIFLEDIGPSLDKQFDNAEVAVAGRINQRGDPYTIITSAIIHLGTTVQQTRHHIWRR